MKLTLLFVGITLLLITSIPVFAQYDEYVGKEVSLQPFGPKGVVHVGVTKKNYNAVTGNLMAQDSANYLTMELAHRGFEVGRDTKVKVLAINFWEKTAEVEILDGTYKGDIGWVLLDDVIGY
jgi:hypothetical protein